MSKIPVVLLVEDDPSVATLISHYLSEEPYAFQHSETGNKALKVLDEITPAVMILDLKLPDMNGLDILKKINIDNMPINVIVITGHGNVNVAVESMQYGAYDFLEKPFNGERLLLSIKNAIEHNRLAGIVEELENMGRSRFQGFIGRSAPMQSVYNIIENVAESKASVMILGESGTGKELCAEAIHKLSDRKSSPFIPLNCAAIPKDLVESELFGHVKGAFTGASRDREGAVSRADNGTLFLDEIGEMSVDVQAKLLRFLQSGTYQKVGSNSTENVDVRILCATHREPKKEIRAGRFREDLYYRLNVIPINLPPLRARGKDINQIARYFLEIFSKEENKEFQSFAADVDKYFIQYTWPGNIRQLQNTIRNIVVLNNGITVSIDMLPEEVKETIQSEALTSTQLQEGADYRPDSILGTMADIRPLWVSEKEEITKAIKLCDGNVPKAAAMLDVSPSTLYRKKQSWDSK